MEKKVTPLTVEEKEEITRRILNGENLKDIAEAVSRSHYAVGCVAKSIEYGEPTEELKQTVKQALKNGMSCKRIQNQLHIPHKIVKDIEEEYIQEQGRVPKYRRQSYEKKQEEKRNQQAMKKQQQKERQEKMEHFIQTIKDNEDGYQQVVKKLTEELKMGKASHTATIAAILLEQGNIKKATQLVDLGIKMIGQEFGREALLKIKDDIIGIHMVEKQNHGWDWEQIASYYQVNITKAKALVKNVKEKQLDKKTIEQKQTEGIDR